MVATITANIVNLVLNAVFLFVMKWDVAGVAYIGMVLDECIRAVLMVLRWKSGKWRTMRLIKA